MHEKEENRMKNYWELSQSLGWKLPKQVKCKEAQSNIRMIKNYNNHIKLMEWQEERKKEKNLDRERSHIT